ncbi:MAG: hypothetical protein M5U31_04635 [Acidimicrobiia bacterium]|nr:hypothetical protein [Acidimicrobiia bacterium]
MKAKTRELWDKQNQHERDRARLFTAVAGATGARSALYPGSYVDLAPSFVFPAVTYVDSDKRAAAFFEDDDGIHELVAANSGPDHPEIRFFHADYTTDLDLSSEAFDLLVSLYAGFVSEHCTAYLRVGGSLLVNPSHGDAAMASIDSRYELEGVVVSRSGRYRVSRSNLDDYLVPKRPTEITADLLHESGRGIGYTKSPFAYLFTRTE